MRRTTTVAVGLAVLLIATSTYGAVAATTTTSSTASDQTDETDRDRLDQLEWWLGGFDLTDEQVAAIVDEAETMRANGASDGEIRRTVLAQLESAGVERAEVRERAHLLPLYGLAGHADLTDAQLDDLAATIEAEWDAGERVPEIKVTVLHELEAMGVDTTDIVDRHFDRLEHRLLTNTDLTAEEVGVVVADARAVYDDGGSFEEIADEVRAGLRALDADWDRRGPPRHPGEAPDGPIDRDHDRSDHVRAIAQQLHGEYDLTREEIRTILWEARELRADGASAAEIRGYIQERAAELDGDDATTEPLFA